MKTRAVFGPAVMKNSRSSCLSATDTGAAVARQFGEPDRGEQFQRAFALSAVPDGRCKLPDSLLEVARVVKNFIHQPAHCAIRWLDCLLPILDGSSRHAGKLRKQGLAYAKNLANPPHVVGIVSGWLKVKLDGPARITIREILRCRERLRESLEPLYQLLANTHPLAAV